jgi:hypothetical protein
VLIPLIGLELWSMARCNRVLRVTKNGQPRG